MLIYFNQKVTQLGIQTRAFCIVDRMLPVNRKEPKVSRLSSATWKPRIISEQGKQIAKFAHNYAGTGCWKKQMPCCNGVDTSVYLTRNGANIQQVFHCERICRTNIMEECK